MKLGEVADDLLEDMLELRTSFCGRLDGRRSAGNRTKRMLEAVEGSR
jgi:putative resolvase